MNTYGALLVFKRALIKYIIDEINGCCEKHDKCYDYGRGKKFCDGQFVGCLYSVSFNLVF